jgi:hypothetical protein
MDSWYATRPLMLHIERAGKLFYCPLKANRQVNQGDAQTITYQRVDSLAWSAEEQLHGKSVHVKDFPKAGLYPFLIFEKKTRGSVSW